MPVEILPTEPARYRFMREVIKLLIARFPEQMKEAAAGIQRTAQSQVDPKTGRWRNDTGGMYFKVSFPSIFMDTLRPLMRRFLPDEEPFATDDSDLLWLMREFPDLIQGTMDAPKKKDHRPRTRLR